MRLAVFSGDIMEIFENAHTQALRLINCSVALTYRCKKSCGKKCHLRLGVSIGTYMQKFQGSLSYVLSVDGKEVVRGNWTDIQDNNEMFVNYIGPCCGNLSLMLCCRSGLAALWLTNKPTGLETKVDGKESYRSCYSLSCTGDEEIPDHKTESSPLKIAGLVGTMNVHGGVRRYFELGNAFVQGGHDYSLFARTLNEKKPWMGFLGKQRDYTSWNSERFDIAITGDHECFRDFVAMKADRKVILIVAKFYADRYIKLWREQGPRLRWIGVAAEWDKGMEEIKGVSIPGGVDTDFFTPVFPKKDRKPVIAFYARLGEGRGIEKIMSLAEILGDEADFIGFDHPGYPTASSGLPKNVRIILTPTQEALRNVLQNADIVVSCMRSAGWNNVMAEGAASGCVPIANDAGIKDIILHGRTGFVCDSIWFEREAADYVRVLAKNPDLMNRMARRASAWIKQFDWNVVAEKLITEALR